MQQKAFNATIFAFKSLISITILSKFVPNIFYSTKSYQREFNKDDYILFHFTIISLNA